MSSVERRKNIAVATGQMAAETGQMSVVETRLKLMYSIETGQLPATTVDSVLSQQQTSVLS